MKKKIILLILLFHFWDQGIVAQNSKSEFYPKANGTIGNRTKVNAVSFRTQNITDPFFDTVKKRFGIPKNDGMFLKYTGYNKNWTKHKIIIRISSSIDTDLDSSKTNTVFIFVETNMRYDLLQPHSNSYKKIKKYFLAMFDRLIKNGKPDNFDL